MSIVLIVITLALAVLDCVITRRLVREARAKGYQEAIEQASERAFKTAVEAEDERLDAYQCGKSQGYKDGYAAGRQDASLFQAPVPTGTAVLPNTPVHHTLCECNECTWPGGRVMNLLVDIAKPGGDKTVIVQFPYYAPGQIPIPKT